MTTMTTVGYGDQYPVTAEGRLVAALLDQVRELAEEVRALRAELVVVRAPGEVRPTGSG